MISLKLNQKLLLFWFGSICLSLLLLSVVFFFLSNELHQNSIREQVGDAFEILDRQLNDRNKQILRIANLFAKRDDIVASLNMIHKYQDPDNYQSIIFDVEKKKLCYELDNLITSGNIDVIVVHDGKKRLASFAYLDSSGMAKTGYLSYENGGPRYFISSADVGVYHQIDELPFRIDDVADANLKIKNQSHTHAREEDSGAGRIGHR